MKNNLLIYKSIVIVSLILISLFSNAQAVQDETESQTTTT